MHYMKANYLIMTGGDKFVSVNLNIVNTSDKSEIRDPIFRSSEVSGCPNKLKKA